MPNRKRVKQVFSILGATVLLGTFLAKETRKDKLKELADSIDAGENNYIIREQNRRTFNELKRFETEFAKFRKHPTEPSSGSGAPSGAGGGTFLEPGEVDSQKLDSIADNWKENQEILDNVIRLANKLSTNSGSHEIELKTINENNEHLKREIASLLVETDKHNKEPRRLPNEKLTELMALVVKANRLNDRINELPRLVDLVSSGTDHLNRSILDDAEREHKSDDNMYLVWTQRFYVLYLFGWLTTIAGILIGEDKEDNPIEKLAD